MLLIKDTIAAIATATGKGGIGIIRISGAKSYTIATKIVHHELKPRYAHFLNFYDNKNQIVDNGIALYFKAPHSYTGEDVVELQAHGGPIILQLLLEIVLNHGARLANPGEFTERAYLNNKIDLMQAEAIADMIDATSRQAVQSASRSLQGQFSQRIQRLLDQLVTLRVHVEAAIDFPEEEHDFLEDAEIKDNLNIVTKALEDILHVAKQGALLREGTEIVIAGKPNAGKSSLLNALAGKESAIVTEIEGTTRDTLSEYIQIKGVPIHIIDTAGLRITQDVVETEGIKRALAKLKTADHILMIIDICEKGGKDTACDFIEEMPENIPITYVYNKIDLDSHHYQNHDNCLYLSAKYNIGIDKLREYLLKAIGYQQTSEGTFTARKRHIDALEQALSNLKQGQAHFYNKAGELLAEALNLAQQDLGLITGKFSADDLLGEIFSQFCMGK